MLSPGTYSLRFEAPDYYTQTINNVVVSSYNSLTTLDVELVSTIIPVELLSFTSEVIGNDVRLNWLTSTETNNMGFNVERKQVSSPQSSVGNLANTYWEKIGFVNGQGTTTEPQTYSFSDNDLDAGNYQYRLKQMDFNGSFEYSNIIDVEIISPNKFSLEQNYPNPFNPSTTIHYTIPDVTLSGVEGSLVQLKVYDVLGNEIATLVNEEKPAGNYEIDFNASKLSSGVYFYTLKVGSFVETKKMILLQ